MATDKPRLSISMSEERFAQVLEFKKEKGIATQSKAILQLMEMGLKGLERETLSPKSPSTAETAPGEEHLIELYRELNTEGQQLVVDYADTMVASGKYIKSNSDKLGNEKYA